MTKTLHPLGIAIHCILLGAAATAAPAMAADDAGRQGDGVTTLQTVHAVALGEDPNQIAMPFSVVSSDEIVERGAATIGEALDNLPGVHADTFGAGSSRPVIRGQVGPRVKVLSDGSQVLDASDISPDHAVTVDPLLGERIEVLRGPATLLYGGGAIGGVVNVLDNKIPTALPENGLEGRFVLRGNSVADEKAFGAGVSKQLGGNLVLHAEASWRDADDYRAPDLEESRVHGTASESRNASLGLSWVTDRGYVGLAYSYRDDDYGLPGHSHEYEGCHPHGSALHCGSHEDDDHDHDHDHDHEDEHLATIDLVSKRVDLRGEFQDPFAGFSRIRFRSSYTDYTHDELEEGEVATTFSNKGHDSRVELEHAPLGPWTGVFGLQHTDTRFSADGLEAFMPTVDSRSTGVFLVEHLDLSEQWHFEVGARHEWVEHTPVNDPRGRPAFDDTATSFSGAAIWSFRPDLSLTFSASHSERLPHAQELYARGVHLATNTYECGLVAHPLTCGGLENNADYGKESSRNFELMLRKTAGDLTFSLGAFANDIDDYIYARTLDRYEDFRLIKYTQRDAEFRGFEAELDYRFTDVLSAGVFADRVDAKFADGSGNVPRIPPSRLGARVRVDNGAFGGEAEFYHVNGQDDIADFESASPAYDMLNLTLNYRLADGRTRVFLRGANLLDEQIWNHASFLAGTVPLPGRNLTVGLSYTF
ncbi:TonB-dependent receptor [Luteimonas sp. Y-2-2-4F]|nr:TonB-dependent receptor [Luteimonas sp. Y-2-2-4F]MCD9031387.1 TonB-dependent receptor [Luteimonas sp. Y-2-2-4F]